MAESDSRGSSASSRKVQTNTCMVKGTGPRGMVIHAETASSATDKPMKAIERVFVFGISVPFLLDGSYCKPKYLVGLTNAPCASAQGALATLMRTL